MTTRDAAVASGAILDLASLSKISAESPADETLRLLWHSMSVCLPCGFLEDLPTRMTGIEREVAGRAIQRLVGSGLVDRFDQERLRLNDVSRSAALKDSDTLALRRCHARILHETFTSDSLSREGLVPEALAAIDYACRKDWQLAQELGLRVSDCLRERMRNEEAAETLRSILVEARRRNDKSAIQKFEWEISWLQDGDQVRAPIVAPQQLQLSFTS